MVFSYSPLVGGIHPRGRWVCGAPVPPPPPVFLFLLFPARPPPLTPRAQHSTGDKKHMAQVARFLAFEVQVRRAAGPSLYYLPLRSRLARNTYLPEHFSGDTYLPEKPGVRHVSDFSEEMTQARRVFAVALLLGAGRAAEAGEAE